MKLLILVLTITMQVILVRPSPYQMFMPTKLKDQITQPDQQWLQPAADNRLQQAPLEWLQLLQDQILQQRIRQMQMQRPYEMDYRMQWPQLHPIPMMILPMDNAIHTNAKHTEKKLVKSENEAYHQYESNSDDNINETDDAAIIEANPEANDLQYQKVLIATPYHGKYILGQIIMAIPFFPFEVNVPDTVSWAWNGISSIIAGIGQRWPFNRPGTTQGTQEEANEVATKLLYKHLLSDPSSKRPMMPIIVIPAQNYGMVDL